MRGQAFHSPALCKSFRSIFLLCSQVRFLARGFSNPGDHTGQASHGYRWPYGPVALITPFNFPLEIPVLQASLMHFLDIDFLQSACPSRPSTSRWRPRCSRWVPAAFCYVCLVPQVKGC